MFLLLGLLLVMGRSFAQQPAAFTVVSSATFQANGTLAPGMIVTGFSSAIDATAIPNEVVITPSAGMPRTAAVFGLAAGQVSFVIPEDLALGEATFNLRRGGSVIASGAARIANVAPGIFTASASGRGAPAGQLLQVAADGSQTFENLFAFDSLGRPLPRPFDPAKAGIASYLILFGTGIRGTRESVTASLGGVAVPLVSASAQGQFPGLDQVNLGPVPASLAGKLAEQELRLSVDGVAANPVTVASTLPASGEWGRRADLPLPNSELSVAELNGKVYLLGGYPASRVTTAAVQVYDAATNTWAIGPPLPAPVNHSMPAVAGGKLYVIGGQSDAGNSSFVNTVFEFDPAVNAWRTRAPLPVARGGGAAAVVDGKIYVAGSRPPRGADFAVYDPQADRWTTLPDLPTARNHLAAVAFEGKVYVIGGRFEAGFTSPTSDTVEIFDTKTGVWSKGAPMPRPRGGLNAVEARGCIHAFGGEGNPGGPNGLFPDHDFYDPVRNTWTRLDPMPIPVHGVTGLVFLKGLIYLPGGGTSEGGSSGGVQHQVYRPQVSCR